MSDRPGRIIDAHVHLWDPARTDWYPYLGGGRDLGMGDVSGMARRFDPAAHEHESRGWNVVDLVNVAAATGRYSVAETLELDRLAGIDGQPAAIIGGLPATTSTAEAVGLIDEQAVATRFRGVRPMHAGGPPVPDDDVLASLADRSLVFELMAHPPDLVDAARRLQDHPDLTVVVEHTGWPRSTEDAERALWAAGLEALADAGDHIHCKLSGLAMPLGAVGVDAFRPWIEPAIEAFGAGRCMFASNFPVDGLHTTLDGLWSTYDAVTAGLGDDDRDLLFAGTAARIYDLGGASGSDSGSVDAS